jgi:predicted nucleotidyltransferase component of viral defense system
MIKNWIDSYQPKNLEETEQALREIMQAIALAGLNRSGFYKSAAFYGGTALRLFYGLNRFSEDLDFSLLSKDKPFTLNHHLDTIIEEFANYGIKVFVKEKIKSNDSNIESAFLKSDTIWKELIFEHSIDQINIGIKPSIKIKIEIDIFPPLGFKTEQKLLINPYSFYVNCIVIEDLFAGKLHALLFRKWGNRVKGRDWYDVEWYIRNGFSVNIKHFYNRAFESRDWNKPTINKDELMLLLLNKVTSVNFNQIKDDIKRFIPDESVLEIWSPDYFKLLFQKIRIQE